MRQSSALAIGPSDIYCIAMVVANLINRTPNVIILPVHCAHSLNVVNLTADCVIAMDTIAGATIGKNENCIAGRHCALFPLV